MNCHGFELVQERVIAEIRSRAYLYRHQKTKAQLLSLVNDDENKVFGISFKTPPTNSTGVAHILEHTVLRGSKKYPVKEPFVELMKGSLKTFLNAFTYPDKTCYPVASQHLQDFYNLIDVYLDCVFYPLLKKDAFETEGWHYEMKESQSPLLYKGIVFNEMKGVFSDPRRIVNYRTMETLLPDTLYALTSGGDPFHIPKLTYEEFVKFHQAYYHPSNSFIYFWGDDPEEHRLALMDQWLSQFEYLKSRSDIALQERFDSPRSFSFPCPAGDSPEEQKKSRVVVNWMLEQTQNDPTLDLALLILHYVLIGTQASPLRKALIDSGFGEDLENGIDAEDDLVQKSFSVGLRGVAPEDIDKIEPLILSTLEKLVHDGIDEETRNATMNTIEFALRERKDFLSTSFTLPPGLFLMVRALGPWIHGGNPIDRLAFEQPLQQIKRSLTHNPRYFEDLLRTYFLENTHRVCVILKPDPTFSLERDKQESASLEGQRARMSSEEINRIVEHTAYLESLRESPERQEDLATIPRLRVSELPRENRRIPIDVLSGGDENVLFHDVETSGILYLDIGFDLRFLSQELIPYVPLFGQALLGMDTETKTYVELAQEIGKNTGGIKIDTLSKLHCISHEPVTWMMVRGKSLITQGESLIHLISELCLRTRFNDKERFRQLVLQRKSELESDLSPSGHVMVFRRLRANSGEAGRVDELMNGFDQLLFVRNVLSDIDERWEKVCESLEQIRRELIRGGRVIANVTTDRAVFEQLRGSLHSLLEEFTPGHGRLCSRAFDQLSRAEGLLMPTQVNYVGAAYDLAGAGYREHGSSLVIQVFLKTSWLWDRVRVRGGAYGGMVSFDRSSGFLSFFSYRDPNIAKTIEIYRQTAEFLEHLSLPQEELERNIVSAIGQIDTYLLPDEKGFTSLEWYLRGDSEERRQIMREQVLSASLDDFCQFGSYLQRASKSERIVVLGSGQSIAASPQELQTQLHLTQIL